MNLTSFVIKAMRISLIYKEIQRNSMKYQEKTESSMLEDQDLLYQLRLKDFPPKSSNPDGPDLSQSPKCKRDRANVKLMVKRTTFKMVRIHGGKVKSVNPRQFISSLKHIATSSMEKLTMECEFWYYFYTDKKHKWKPLKDCRLSNPFESP
ncbi:hypothetical protein Tco_0074030 [Tanacetum coccineum]